MLANIELGEEKRYELVASTGTNGFFVRRELFAAVLRRSRQLRRSTRCTIIVRGHIIEIFQGYDGTIFAAGELKLALAAEFI